MKKLIITTILIATMVSISACGSGKSESKNTGESTQAESVSSEEQKKEIAESTSKATPTVKPTDVPPTEPFPTTKPTKVPPTEPLPTTKPTDVPQVESAVPEEVSNASEIEEIADEIETEGGDENPYYKIDTFSASAVQDYAHISNDQVILGNGENLTITVAATPADLIEDDFFVYYDESLISAEVVDVTSNSSNNTTKLTISVSAVSPGTSDLYILSSYDIYTLPEEEWRAITYSIKGLDSVEGQIVYVTPTGEKYHFSAECAGENAIATTLYDAELDEYKPCGNCVG